MSTPPPAPPTKNPGFRGLTAIALACLALLLGLASAGIAWRASSKAGDALNKVAALQAAAAQGRPVGVATPASTTTAPADDTATAATDTPDPGGSDPTLSPETQFTVKYTDETLQVVLPNCNTTVNVDLDEPRVGVEGNVSELSFHWPCGGASPTFNLGDGVRGSEADSPTVRPAECVDKIRLGPLPSGDQPIRQGQVYCINTSLGAAQAAADKWRMAVVTISAITDTAVSIKSSAWNIPG